MIRKCLKKIARFSEQHPFIMVAIVLIITVFAMISAKNVKFQTAFEKMLPQNDPIIKTFYDVRDEFGGTDVIIIAVKVVPSDNPDRAVDVRDPRVLKAIKELEDSLKTVNGITGVSSPVDKIIALNNGTVPNDIETVKEILQKLPESERLKIFNIDYTMTTIYAYTDEGDNQKKLIRLMREVYERIDDAPFPPGIEVLPTGTPPMRELLYRLMNESQIYTTAIGFIGIFIILVLYFRRPVGSFLPLLPIIIAIIWTGGAMGLLGIPVDMATAGIGSLILGLGIDYGIHLMHRFYEERKRYPIDKAIEIAVVETGSAVLATTATTVVGFLALVISPLPIMENLGKVCALGITFSMIIVLTLLPAMLIIEIKYIEPYIKKLIRRV